MSKVLITKSKLDNLANAISAKSNSATSLSLEQMVTAVQSIPTGSIINNQNKTIAPTEERQYIIPDENYTGLSQVIVEPISSTYIGSGIDERNSSDLSAAGATVTVPAGYYSTQATKSVTAGTAGTPIAAKSAVSNNSVTITPSVTNTTGYITGETLNGATVSVTASELVNGTLNIDDDGTYDVTNYASAEVDIDYSLKTVPLTLVNHTSNAISVFKAYYPQILSEGYISNTNTISATANANTTIRMPYGGMLYLRTSTSKTNFELRINNIVKEPQLEGRAGTSNYFKAYNLGKVDLPIAGTTMDIYDSSDEFKDMVVLNTLTITTNDTYAAPSGTAYSSVTVNVPIGSTINNQNKSVTPTKSQQSISADSGYTGLGTVTVNAIPAEYITTSDADAVAADILEDKTAYVDGSKITGSMPNNGATGGTIAAQGGTYTIPAGYTTGGTVTANLISSPITNSALNVASFEETTGDYGVRASITIPAGYYENTTLTKDLSTVLPAPDTAIAENQMLAGYQAYNNEGELLTGTMTNNAAWSRTLDQTTTSVTIPTGYHNGTGTVSHTTVDIPNPAISVSNGGLITASGSWTRGFTTDNSYSNTQQLTTQAAKIVTPTESEQNAVAAGVYTTGIVKVGAISSTYVGSGITQRDSDDLTVSGATVTAPAGYYAEAASKSVASMTLPTAVSTSATSGATNKATIGRSTSTRYINIPVGYNSSAAYYTISATPNGSVTAPNSISGTTATVSTGTNTLTLTKTVSVTPNVTTAGYISSGTAGNSSISLTANVTTKAAATITPGTSDQTIASGTYLTGAQTIVGDTDLIAKNIKSGISIFGVTGNFTADATATAEDIIQGETAYINGAEITGTLIVNKYYTGSAAPSSSLGNNGDIYFQN